MRFIGSCRRVVLTVATTLLLLPAALQAQFVYVSNNGTPFNTPGDVSAFTINSSTGALTPVPGSPFPAGLEPVFVAVDPSGKFAYVAGNIVGPSPGNVSAFTINSSTGTLTAVAGSPFPAGAGPTSMAVDPIVSPADLDSTFIYVVNNQDNTISGYVIDPTNGALITVGGSPFLVGFLNFPLFMAIHPSGKFAYVTVSTPGFPSNGNISVYTIGDGGNLQPIPGSPFPAVPGPIAVDPSGKFAYVPTGVGLLAVPGSIQGFTIDSTSGEPTPFPGSPVPTGPNPTAIAIDPSGKFVYVVSDNYPLPSNVQGYTINSSTGALTPVPGSPFPAGLEPVFVAVDPSGKFVYVANVGSNNVSGYMIDPTNGVLTPISGSPFPAGIGPNSVAITGCAKPPNITGLSASPATLWPPNHELIDVLVNYDVAAPCGEPAVCTLSVASSEPDDQASPDWVVVDEHHVELRAERLGNRTGRIYTVTVRCKDARGNLATQNTAVIVSHDQGH
jgi:6-phosphogluconolactonase